ncbi:MAG: right-handed parallel beta-helix repeat-containing protein [Inquilinaceae bacterium]
MFGAYGRGDDPVFDGDRGESVMINIKGVDYIRVENLEVTGSKHEGVRVHDSKGSQLINLNVHNNLQDGIEIKHGSSHTLVQGGESHHNGSTGHSGPWNGRLGHGILISDKAHDNVIDGVDLYNNIEDGLQFGPTSGDGNVIRNSKLHHNEEDAIDIKAGAQIIENNYMYENVDRGVFLHDFTDKTILTGNVIKVSKNGYEALSVYDGATVVSKNNYYEGGGKPVVKLGNKAGSGSVFSGDIFVDGGKENGMSVAVESGKNHVFSASAFVMRGDGIALTVQRFADDVTVKNSVLYSADGTLLKASGKDVEVSGNIYYRADSSSDWVRIGRSRFDKDDVQNGNPDGSGKVQNPSLSELLSDGAPPPASKPKPDTSGSGSDNDNDNDDPPVVVDPPKEPAKQPPKQPPVTGDNDNDNDDDGPSIPNADRELVLGSSKSESIRGRSDHEEIRAGDGNDTVRASNGHDLIDAGKGNDKVWGQNNDDVIHGRDGNDWLHGGNGDDSVHGDDGNDKLYGAKGDDYLSGGDGDDHIRGHQGDDVIIGGKGNDNLWGDSGKDRFVFERGDDDDVIRDFVSGQDLIDLSDYGFDSMSDFKIEEKHGEAIIVLNGGDSTIRLDDVSASQVHDDDFVLQNTSAV